MPVWGIVLLVIFVILLAVFIGLMIFGNKLRKQQDEQQAQIDAAKQVMSMLIIDNHAHRPRSSHRGLRSTLFLRKESAEEAG